jgi:hypothetical protein
MFSRLDQEKWPVLRVHHVEGDDRRVHPTAHQLNQDTFEAFAAVGGEGLVRTTPIRIQVVPLPLGFRWF